jgi:hypothetical protein
MEAVVQVVLVAVVDLLWVMMVVMVVMVERTVIIPEDHTANIPAVVVVVREDMPAPVVLEVREVHRGLMVMVVVTAATLRLRQVEVVVAAALQTATYPILGVILTEFLEVRVEVAWEF